MATALTDATTRDLERDEQRISMILAGGSRALVPAPAPVAVPHAAPRPAHRHPPKRNAARPHPAAPHAPARPVPAPTVTPRPAEPRRGSSRWIIDPLYGEALARARAVDARRAAELNRAELRHLPPGPDE